VDADIADEACGLYMSLKMGDLMLLEQVIGYFETAYPPFNRHRLAQIGNVLMNVSSGIYATCRSLETCLTAGSINQEGTRSYPATLSPYPW
jgi:hypothetical protein